MLITGNKNIFINFFSILIFTLTLTFVQNFSKNTDDTTKQKTFFITSSASSDYLAAWWYNKLKTENRKIEVLAIGGKQLKQANVPIWKHYNQLTIGTVGFVKFIKQFSNQWKERNKITKHILDNNFMNVVIVDTVLSGILIARSLKKQKPKINITYIAPPEMWIWGRWGMDKLLKKYCNKIIVIYPFEPKFYKKYDLKTEWLGWPYYKDFEKYFHKKITKEKNIALFPGSRWNEIEIMIPIFAEVVKKFKNQYDDVKFTMPIAQTFTFDQIKKILKKHGVEDSITLIQGNKSYDEMQSCCLAITKPGTTTLQLALLQIPTIVTYRVPWFTYFLLKLIIQKPYISLASILLDKTIQTEIIQSDCNAKTIFEKANQLYLSFLKNDQSYQNNLEQLLEVRKKLNTSYET